MLDISLFRENLKLIKDSEKKRGKDPKLADKVVDLDKKWRSAKQKLQILQHNKNETSLQINSLKKQGKSVSSKVKEVQKISNEIKNLEQKTAEFLKDRDELRYKIGNILHEDVPIGPEENFKLIRKWGKPTKIKNPKHHADLVIDLDLAELDKAAEVSGARFYYLKNEGVILNFALLRLALDIVMSKGFTPLWTPYMINYENMKASAELADFEETLYKIKDEDLYLIPSSEQAIAALKSNTIFNSKELPLKFTAYSSCFRREAGSHGKDTKGIFRVHQFDKIEQSLRSTGTKYTDMQKSCQALENKIKNVNLPGISQLSGKVKNYRTVILDKAIRLENAVNRRRIIPNPQNRKLIDFPSEAAMMWVKENVQENEKILTVFCLLGFLATSTAGSAAMDSVEYLDNGYLAPESVEALRNVQCLIKTVKFK